MSFLRDMTGFIFARKKFWLIPALVMMTLLGGLIILTKGSVVAPFIYTLFYADDRRPWPLGVLS